MNREAQQQRELDEQHLHLLAIFQCVYAVFICMWGALPLIHVTLGVVIMVAPQIFSGPGGGPAPPPLFGAMIVCMGAGFIFLFWLQAGCLFVSARCLARRRWRMFCMVVAAVICAQAPLGTVLGVFTIIVLARESVKQLFEEQAKVAAAEQQPPDDEEQRFADDVERG